MSDMIPLRSKDTVPFHCGRCAACCRNIKDTIMVEPIDAFRLARFFHGRSGYSQIRGVEGVYSWFTHISTLEGIFPIYLMNATGPEGACTFLETDGARSMRHAPGCAGSTRLRHFPAHAAGILYFTSAWTAMPATSPGDGPW